MVEKLSSRETNEQQKNNEVFALGDSLSKGMLGVEASFWVEWGKETKWMLDVMQKNIQSLWNKNIVFVLGGTNDLFNHKSSNEVIKNLESIKKIAEANGKIFIPATIPYMNRAREKQGSASLETINQGVDEVNNYIRSNFSQYADFNTLLKDWQSKKISDLYASKDGIHLNSKWYNLMHQEFIRVVSSVSLSWNASQAELESKNTDSYKNEKQWVETKTKEEIEKTRQNIVNQIDALKLSLAEAKTDSEKFELQRQILRLKKFISLQNGENIADETLKKEVMELLKGKTPDNYKNADLLTLKKKWFDIATLLLVDKKSENEVISANMKVGDEFMVNFGNNAHFARRTGAGDLLPATVREVEINGVKGIRWNNPRPGYYTEKGKYLPIFDGYDIKIAKIGESTSEDEQWIETQFQNSLATQEPDKYEFVKLMDISKLEKWDKGLLDFIAKAEWTYDNYNAIFGNGTQNKIDFTNMTLREVLAYQQQHARKTGSSAIGRYQFIRDTLETLIVKHWVSRSEKFTAELQDKFALSLLEGRGLLQFKEWKISFEKFQLNLSQEWASIAKDSSGLSYYHGDKMNNKATKAGRQVASVLRHLYSEPTQNA